MYSICRKLFFLSLPSFSRELSPDVVYYERGRISYSVSFDSNCSLTNFAMPFIVRVLTSYDGLRPLVSQGAELFVDGGRLVGHKTLRYLFIGNGLDSNKKVLPGAVILLQLLGRR